MEFSQYVLLAVALLLCVGLGQTVPAGKWTRWYDHDNPSGNGDYETMHVLTKSYPEICSSPVDIQCRRRGTNIPAKNTGQVLSPACILGSNGGLACINSKQRAGHHCYDYEVRLKCPEPDTKKLTTWVKTKYYQSVKEMMKYKGTQCSFTSPIQRTSTLCKKLQDIVLIKLFPEAFTNIPPLGVKKTYGPAVAVGNRGIARQHYGGYIPPCCKTRITWATNSWIREKGGSFHLVVHTVHSRQTWDQGRCMRSYSYCGGRRRSCREKKCKQIILVWRSLFLHRFCRYIGCAFKFIWIDKPCACECAS